MDKAVTYTLKLSGEGLQLEREVAPEVAHAIVRLAFGGGIAAFSTLEQVPAPAPPSPSSAAVVAAAAGVSLSVREFLETHNAKRIQSR